MNVFQLIVVAVVVGLGLMVASELLITRPFQTLLALWIGLIVWMVWDVNRRTR